jgi:hypothetical protein
MMQREWKALGHPAPLMKNDRAHKAFGFFIPGLDKEVDMASDLMKAMFAGTGRVSPKTREVTKEVTGEVTGEVMRLLACVRGEMTRRELQSVLELRAEENFRKKYLMPALDADYLEMTIPDKPNSRLQKYRLTQKGVDYVKTQAPKA